jgi:hypothetical protein
MRIFGIICLWFEIENIQKRASQSHSWRWSLSMIRRCWTFDLNQRTRISVNWVHVSLNDGEDDVIEQGRIPDEEQVLGSRRICPQTKSSNVHHWPIIRNHCGTAPRYVLREKNWVRCTDNFTDSIRTMFNSIPVKFLDDLNDVQKPWVLEALQESYNPKTASLTGLGIQARANRKMEVPEGYLIRWARMHGAWPSWTCKVLIPLVALVPCMFPLVHVMESVRLVTGTSMGGMIPKLRTLPAASFL